MFVLGRVFGLRGMFRIGCHMGDGSMGFTLAWKVSLFDGRAGMRTGRSVMRWAVDEVSRKRVTNGYFCGVLGKDQGTSEEKELAR